MIRFIRKLADGRVVEKGSCPPGSWEELKSRQPGEYFIDPRGDTPLSPIPAPALPQPKQNNYPSVEELTDALLKHLDGDVSAFAAIRARLKK